jgi:hypothetical protein
MTNTLRPATPADLPLIAAFIRELAEYEKLAHEVRFDEGVLATHLFGPHPMAEVVIGEIDGTPRALRCSSTISPPLKGGPASIWKTFTCARRARQRAGQGAAAASGGAGRGARLRKAGMERAGLERAFYRFLPIAGRQSEG